jgi:undecaprenyl-diphosphatase
MLETILNWDKNLFLFLNRINHPSLDSIMLFISYSYIPAIITFLIILYYGHKKFQKGVIYIILGCLLTFGLSDLISTRVFKDNFKRLRPCHEKELSTLTYTGQQKCGGGKYGFVSSHAANTMSLAVFIFLVFYSQSKLFISLIGWSLIVSYSRIYLGRHYPLDLIVAWMIGIFIAWIVFRLFKKIAPRFTKINRNF